MYIPRHIRQTYYHTGKEIMIFSKAPVARSIEMQFSIGGGFDIPTASFIEAVDGEMAMLSGKNLVNSIMGPENAFKTGVINFIEGKVLNNYPGNVLIIFDTEGSFTYVRINRFIKQTYPRYGRLINDLNTDLIQMVKQDELAGDKFFEMMKEVAAERFKDKGGFKTTAYVDTDGSLFKTKPAIGVLIDSFTEMKFDVLAVKMTDKNEVGSSETLTVPMQAAKIKSEMITQYPKICRSGSIYISQVAHMDTKVEINMYAPKPHKLAFSKSGTVAKGVTGKFKFINNNLYEIQGYAPLYKGTGKADRVAMYPLNDSDKEAGTVDLMVVHLTQTRNKTGPSGPVISLVISQSAGVLEALTDFYNVKVIRGNYGIGGNNLSYWLELCPDVKLSRTTVRTKLDESYRLRRGVEIMHSMAQYQAYHNITNEAYLVKPDELYASLIEKGYDWNVLLDTVNFHTYEENKLEFRKSLSLLDLLRLHSGENDKAWYEAWLGRYHAQIAAGGVTCYPK